MLSYTVFNKVDKLKMSAVDKLDMSKYPLVIAPKESEYISVDELAIKIRKKDESILVIDVRDPNIDHNGGHIPNSINIPYDKFDDSIKDIIEKIILSEVNISKVIIHCMESKHRGPRCCNKFTNFKKKLMDYKINEQMEEKNEVDNDIQELLNKYDNLKDILSRIKVYLLSGGFQEYMNKFHSNNGLIQDYDEKYWKLNENDTLIHTLYDIKANEKLVSNIENDQ